MTIVHNNNLNFDVLFQFLLFSYLRRMTMFMVTLHTRSTEYETLEYVYVLLYLLYYIILKRSGCTDPRILDLDSFEFSANMFGLENNS
jgi:hypothetical protein